MSISMLIEDDTVGKLKACWECVFENEEKNLFPRSLMGTIIQDGGTRERRNRLLIVATLQISINTWSIPK